MCRVVRAEMSLSKFRVGRDASRKAVRIQIKRVLEHNTTKRLRGKLLKVVVDAVVNAEMLLCIVSISNWGL